LEQGAGDARTQEGASVKSAKSAFIQMMDLVWDNANDATSHSWERLNGAMHSALNLGIGSGFKLDEDDIACVMANYSTGYWIGESSEWVYGLAIAVENASAIKSFEKWKGRAPIIADDVTLNSHSGYTHGGHLARAKERLAVGSKFPFRGLELTVTSFNGDSCTACSYKETGKSYERKIDKRFKITRELIIEERAERKERGKLIAELDTEEFRAFVWKNKEEQSAAAYVSKMTIEQLRKAHAKYSCGSGTFVQNTIQNSIDKKTKVR
jgi:hypothetical protein